MFRSVWWAPTIALSWLWGLGFFYSFYVTITYGFGAFVAFAVANALGLFLFGWVLGSPRREAAAIFARVQTRYAGLFLICQVLAVAVVLLAAAAYLFIPLLGLRSIPLVAVLVLLAAALGHSASMRRLRILHGLYLVGGIAAAVLLVLGMARIPSRPLAAASGLDARFLGLAVPALVGFLLGPWADVQNWQRAVEIRAENGSIRAAYGWGALLFLGLVSFNAGLAMRLSAALGITDLDTIAAVRATLAGVLGGGGNGALLVALLIWAVVAVAATLDSFYFATRWLLRATTARSESPLLAFVPAGLVTTPLWFLATAILVALGMVGANLGMIYLMLPFATLIAGGTACLVAESLGSASRYDAVLNGMIGTAAFLVLATGYLGGIPAMMSVAPAIALVGALPAVHTLLFPKAQPKPEAAPAKAAVMVAAATEKPEIDTDATVLGHGFDGQWFYMHLVPTYDDTNSVGNVYFANYFRWIGKARELLFNSCMPEFDLRNTSFYVLTKSFEHDFRREIREFTPVTVRLRMSTYNRKFVTLVHEIHSKTEGLVGKGEQTLMFVDSVQFKPLDIPPVILRSFTPYFAQALRLNAPRRAPATIG